MTSSFPLLSVSGGEKCSEIVCVIVASMAVFLKPIFRRPKIAKNNDLQT